MVEVLVPRGVLVPLIEVEELFDTDGEGVSDFVFRAERLEEKVWEEQEVCVWLCVVDVEALAVLEDVPEGEGVCEEEAEVDLENQEADEEGLGLELILNVLLIVFINEVVISLEKETLCVKDFMVVIVWVIVNNRERVADAQGCIVIVGLIETVLELYAVVLTVLEEELEPLRELLGVWEEVCLTLFVIRTVPEEHTELVEVFVIADDADLVPHPVDDFEEEAELV